MELLKPILRKPVPHLQSNVHTITGVPTAVTAFVGRAASGPLNQPTTLAAVSDFQTTFGGLWQGSELGYAVQDFFSNGGTQAIVVRLQNAASPTDPLTPADYLPVGDAATQQGLYALEQINAFNLLVLSPDRNAAGAIDLDPSVIAAAAAYCEQRRAMLLVDPPASWTSVAAVTSAMSDPSKSPLGTNSSNAAVFFPRIRKPDLLNNGLLQTFAPSGAVAGVMARVDGSRGVWKSPAGTGANLVGVASLSLTVRDTDNSAIQPLAVNALRSMPTIGNVVWGARTLAGADTLGSQFKYIPVRRTALYIEESLRNGLAWTSGEASDETLWAAVRMNVNTFLHGLFVQGAFQGTTPAQAYFVKCDAETTTPSDATAGVANLMVGFAPLKPAEFIVLQLQLKTMPGSR